MKRLNNILLSIGVLLVGFGYVMYYGSYGRVSAAALLLPVVTGSALMVMGYIGLYLTWLHSTPR